MAWMHSTRDRISVEIGGLSDDERWGCWFERRQKSQAGFHPCDWHPVSAGFVNEAAEAQGRNSGSRLPCHVFVTFACGQASVVTSLGAAMLLSRLV